MSHMDKIPENKEKLSMNVLLADDDKDSRGAIADTLKYFGCTVEEVINGKELVARIASSKHGEFGLIVTDNNMPEMDGVQAIENIRADARFRKIPVVLCSGLLDEDIKKKINELGGVSIEKPFLIDSLKVKIKEALLKSEDDHFTS